MGERLEDLEFGGLAAVGRLLERGVDLDIILDTMVDEAVRRLEADRGTLYLVDRTRRQIFSKAAHLPELNEIRLELGQGVAGTVAVTGDLLSIADAYADPRFENQVDRRTGYRTDSMLAAPVPDHGGDIIGVLQILNKRQGAHFDHDDEQTLIKLTEQIGQVIEKTSLYQELKPRRPDRLIDYRYNFIVGTSTAMRQVYELVDKAARTSATVILQGESGTGKGLIARAIHLNSDRSDKPFVTLDCTTLPPALIENELFGHERGAFTGAEKATPGKFELARGGTVFIDEIGELPLELQAKLLRVIQEREFERVGGTETIQVDFRLLAATNRTLDQMVADGTFRADLYYRIRVVPILLPPLRARGEDDIRRLAEHFIDVFAKKHRRDVQGLSALAMSRLLAHRWPGNIRELENCIESAVVLADGRVIDAGHLALPGTAISDGHGPVPMRDLSRPLSAVEQEYILAVVDDVGGNQSEAARRLEVSRNTLARKLKSYRAS